MTIEKDLFWDMIEDSEYHGWKLEDLYLQLLAEKLKKDTGIYFSGDRGELVARSIGLTIYKKDFTTYDDLLSTIESFLGTGDEKEDKKLMNDFNWIKDWFWFDEGKNAIKGSTFTTDNNTSKSGIFEVIYYALTGQQHKDLGFAQDLGREYLKPNTKAGDEAFFGKIVIPELDSLEFNFQKNGYIKIKGMSETEWNRLKHVFMLVKAVY